MGKIRNFLDGSYLAFCARDKGLRTMLQDACDASETISNSAMRGSDLANALKDILVDDLDDHMTKYDIRKAIYVALCKYTGEPVDEDVIYFADLLNNLHQEEDS